MRFSASVPVATEELTVPAMRGFLWSLGDSNLLIKAIETSSRSIELNLPWCARGPFRTTFLQGESTGFTQGQEGTALRQ